ncbi:glycoside hydrolase family 3 [Leptobacterium flavescens]|uniref:beta-N-acetylhexosaminidase n=1 Tax=Leptobacterium flavescens TaxID=472055 RepID=A0A6P0UM03_9FLAO|nr:glycoside hydrolase family 3 protein [Leptobacterium flavescens]NER13460.1 glycoside hydrolase family 3 [Leptobacterium flavescens]
MFKKLIVILLGILIFSCGKDKERSADPELKEMIGQMIMIGFRGMEVDSIDKEILNQIDSGYVGGLILFDYDLVSRSANRNIRSPQQLRSLISDLQQRSETPLFMAVDQEGGLVNRLKPKYGFPQIASAAYLGKINNPDSTRYYASLNAHNLRTMGFNVNFAPVVDIDLNPQNPVIGKYERSYGDNAELVITHAKEWIQVHDSLGIISTLKHFPGHGSSDSDSHEGFTDITAYWSEEELQPFKSLSQMDYRMGIMTAHVFNSKLDPDYPATLSKKIIQDILRDQWKYRGLIFSDDLQMKAVNKLYDTETILKNSINSGVDVLVFGNNLEYDELIPKEAVDHIIELVEKGEISKERIRESYDRIMKVKENLK